MITKWVYTVWKIVLKELLSMLNWEQVTRGASPGSGSQLG